MAQQRAGVRAGVSGDPNQFYFGGHLGTSSLVDALTCRPNAEIGIGDDVTLVAFTGEFLCGIPLKRPPRKVL